MKLAERVLKVLAAVVILFLIPGLASAAPEDDLRKASAKGDIKGVKDALAEGADINSTDKFGFTALMVASNFGRLEVVKLLVDKGADANVKTGEGATAASIAESKNFGEISDYLKKNTAAGAPAGASGKPEEAANDRPAGSGGKNSAELVTASEKGELDRVKSLVGAGADVNSTNESGWTALTAAISNDHSAVAEFLIKNGANVNYGGDGESPVMVAIVKKNAAVLKALIENKATLDFKNNNGSNLFMYAVEKGNSEVALVIMEKTADLNAARNDGATALSLACEFDAETVAVALAEKGAAVNVKHKDGTTPLMFAAGNGREALSKLLIEKGGDVNAKAADGMTPLLHASLRGRLNVVKLLMDKGAKFNETGNLEREILVKVAEVGKKQIIKALTGTTEITFKVKTVASAGRTHPGRKPATAVQGEEPAGAAPGTGCDALRLAIVKNDVDMAIKALKDGETPDGLFDDYREPLMELFVKADPAIAAMLIKNGLDINILSPAGDTLLVTALLFRRLDVARILIENNANMNLPDAHGLTPILLAVESGDAALVKMMIDNGADVNARYTIDYGARGYVGITALGVARQKKYSEIVRMLEEIEADETEYHVHEGN